MRLSFRHRAHALASLLAASLLACSHAPAPQPSSSAPAADTTGAHGGSREDSGDAAAAPVTSATDGGANAGATGTDAAASAKHYERILHVGDSTVGGYGGLAKALKVRFDAEGSVYTSDTTVSLGIRTLARSKRLKTLLAKEKPDLVLLTIGTNDISLPSPDQLAGDVRTIVATVGDRDCYWIGPPTWKPDTGIVAVIRENSGHCRFFDSSLLPLARAGDGIHPTDKGGEEWARRFWAVFRGSS